MISGKRERVVGKTGDLRYNFGVHTVFMTLDDAQDLSFAGQPLASAVITKGVPREPLGGVERADQRARSRPISSDRPRAASSRSTSSRCCCGSSPPGIIALIVYLTALERVRDFAVLKATGTSNATLFGALAFQAVVLSLVSAVVAIAIAHGARAVLPVPDRDRDLGVRPARSRSPSWSDWSRASPGSGAPSSVDPAIAFGGA